MIVGHRPSTLAQADKILLLREGAVQAFGPRNAVLGKMREAAQAQAATEAIRQDASRDSLEAALAPAPDPAGPAAAEPADIDAGAGPEARREGGASHVDKP